jgi:hypothetical protein
METLLFVVIIEPIFGFGFEIVYVTLRDHMSQFLEISKYSRPLQFKLKVKLKVKSKGTRIEQEAGK